MNELFFEKAFAKVNLTLQIKEKRPDGFHELSGVFHTVSLCDELTFEKTDGGIVLECDKELCKTEDNLAYRAAKLFFEKTGISSGIKIKLKKNIPSGAGMGGGSADAGAVLRALNRIFGSPLSLCETAKVGALLGSDVPFCVYSGCALCEGRGEKIRVSEPCKNVFCTVLFDNQPVYTKQMYQKADEMPKSNEAFEHEKMLEAVKKSSPEEIAKYAKNSFDALSPDNLTKLLINAGALCAHISGSGSAAFGIFESEKAAKAAQKQLCDKVALCEVVSLL